MDSSDRSGLPVDQLFQSFDSYLRRRGRAVSTRPQYLYSLRSFADWLGVRDVGALTPADLELFLTQWEAGFQTRRGHLPRPATMRGTIGALRVFFAYLEQAELLIGGDGAPRRNPVRTIDAPQCPQRANDFLRPYEDRALLHAECHHHHRIIVWLLRYTGIRVAEAQALTLADVDLTSDHESLTVRDGKTPASTRTIPILPQLLPLIHAHLAYSRTRTPGMPDTPFIATSQGKPLTTNYMWRVVKRVAHEAGVRPIPCTCLKPSDRISATSRPTTDARRRARFGTRRRGSTPTGCSQTVSSGLLIFAAL